MNFREQLKLFRLAHFARAASIKIELVWLLCTWKSVFPRWRNWKSLRFLTLVLLLLGISLRFSPLYTKQKKRFFQSRLQQLDSQSINQFTSLFSGHCHHSIFFLSYFLSLPQFKSQLLKEFFLCVIRFFFRWLSAAKNHHIASADENCLIPNRTLQLTIDDWTALGEI